MPPAVHTPSRRPRLLVFIVAYHAESTIASVLARIPHSLADEYDTEVLIIDDGSKDRTFERGASAVRTGARWPIRVLYNPVNQGYGGNQKIGYHYAIRRGFDFVVLLHGDGQYAPECLPDLLAPLKAGEADACFGSRMAVRGAARKGGMPLYKYVGNRILTAFQNRVLGTAFSEFHSGYRAYSVQALSRVPFDLNTHLFHFDTEIIVQFVRAGLRIVERPIPTYYGNEISRVNGLAYARDVVRAVIRARAQDLGVFYDARFDCVPATRGNAHYMPKLDFDSPHTFARALIPRGSRVLDLGCAGGQLASAIRGDGNYVVGVDACDPIPGTSLDEFHRHDLNTGLPAVAHAGFDVILLLDVIEHMAEPESLVRELRAVCANEPDTLLIVSTGNVAFIVTRLMLLVGQFNYGKRGILDLTHTRLFTFGSLRRLFEQHGFRLVSARGIPAPMPLALGNTPLARLLLAVNRWLIRLSRGLFSYQAAVVLQGRPSLELLLDRAEQSASTRSEASSAASARQ